MIASIDQRVQLNVTDQPVTTTTGKMHEAANATEIIGIILLLLCAQIRKFTIFASHKL